MDVFEYLPLFLADAREQLEDLNLAVVRIEESPDDRETVDEVFRIAHSLKASSAMIGFAGMAALTHQMEDVFELFKQRTGGLSREAIDVLLECLDVLSACVDAIEDGGAEEIEPDRLIVKLESLVRERSEEHDAERELPDAADMPDVAEEAEPAAPESAADLPAERVEARGPTARRRDHDAARKGASTVRVDAERLDQLMRYMGELAVHRTRVESICSRLDVPDLHQAVQDLTRAFESLQYMAMQVRLIPMEAVFVCLPRLVRDLSQKLDKQVELVMIGQATQLDRTLVGALGGPMVHLVRNALDHGLESPADREAAGKPATGTVEISARQIGGNVVISVKDDGRGIDAERVGRKAVERGLIPAKAVADIDQARAAELLFAPGFSTADEVTEISGRGVGMDAVRTTMRELGGEVTLNSVKGEGTTAQIRLPLTVSGGAVMANGETALIVDCDALTTGGGAFAAAAA